MNGATWSSSLGSNLLGFSRYTCHKIVSIKIALAYSESVEKVPMTSMLVLVVLGRKCTLAASRASPGEPR